MIDQLISMTDTCRNPSIGMPAGTTFSTGMNIIAATKGTGAVGTITIDDHDPALCIVREKPVTRGLVTVFLFQRNRKMDALHGIVFVSQSYIIWRLVL